jgi:two-component system, sensor histidine kinase
MFTGESTIGSTTVGTSSNNLADKLRHARRQYARQSLAMLTAGHGLRQHLQIVAMALDRLAPAGDSFTTAEWLDTAKTQLARVALGLDHLVECADFDIDIDHLTPRLCAFQINRILYQVENDWRVFAASKCLSLVVKPCEATVRSDPRLLSVILDNIVENAVRYTRSGEVRMECQIRDRHLFLCVHDTGPGIPHEVLARILNPSQPARSEPWMNSGLSVVRRTAALLGHEIGLRTTHGEGSYFKMRVPVAGPPSGFTSASSRA